MRYCVREGARESVCVRVNLDMNKNGEGESERERDTVHEYVYETIWTGGKSEIQRRMKIGK